MISLESVSKTFNGSSSPAVSELSLSIEQGETVVLVGPSGCGKTTTMKMINRLIEPSGGRILLDGTDVMDRDPVQLRRGMGYVIQSIGLLPHRTVADNIATVPRLEGWPKDKITQRVDELTDLMQLDRELLNRYPGELSGGQRQRVGVARALGVDPPVMLMDEPFGAVDPIVRVRLQDEFLRIQQRLRKTIVFVTHDIDEAIKMADRIAILNVGGKLEQFDTPENILRQPANDFVRSFVGAERGLKRLALRKVTSIKLSSGPVVSPSDSATSAQRIIQEHGMGWASVVEGTQLLGWIDVDMLKGAEMVSEAVPRRFMAHVTAESSLREALDRIVTSRTNVAVVLGSGQEFLGILTLAQISEEIIS